MRRLPAAFPSARTVGIAIGAGRAALGAGFLLAPVASVRVLGLDTATAQRVTWLAQMAAVRDGALGAGTAAATARGRGGGWLLAGAASDLTDAVVISAALRQGRLRGVRAQAVVGFAAAMAAMAGWAAVSGRRR